MGRPFNIKRLDTLGRQLGDSGCNAEQREALQEEIDKSPKPAQSIDLYALYRSLNIDAAAARLAKDVSPGYANDFAEKLQGLYARLCKLERRACDVFSGSKTHAQCIDYVAERVMSVHHAQLERRLPNLGRYPELHEMTEDEREVEIDIVEEHFQIKSAMVKVANYIQTMAAMLRHDATATNDGCLPKRLPKEWQQIVDVLHQEKHRMTTDEILSAIEKEHGSATASVYKKALSDMVTIGILDNVPSAIPRGYGLTGAWSRLSTD